MAAKRGNRSKGETGAKRVLDRGPGAAPRHRNLQYAWLLLNYALGADIVYRAAFARQAYGQIADLVFIWLGSLLFYTVLELSVTGSLVGMWRVSTIPMTVIGVVAAGVLLLVNIYWSGRLILTGGMFIAGMIVLALLVIARRRNRI